MAPTPAAGDAMTRWHSMQSAAEHWSWWCNTMTIVVANTSTINRAEMMTRRMRVGSVIASEPFKASKFHDTSAILIGVIRNSIGCPFGGIGYPMGKFAE